MPYTLCVIDMQPDFEAANGTRVIKNCVREIRMAVENGAHIVFLEFDGYGDTHPMLMTPVKKYKNAKIKFKRQDDGSAEVQEVVRKNGFMIGRFRVVGINTDWCVRSTVHGLRKRFPNSFVEVVDDACSSDDNHAYGIKMIRSIDNVDVI